MKYMLTVEKSVEKLECQTKNEDSVIMVYK